jgi:hypothetical protein
MASVMYPDRGVMSLRLCASDLTCLAMLLLLALAKQGQLSLTLVRPDAAASCLLPAQQSTCRG